jgi:outer membrane protein TolC
VSLGGSYGGNGNGAYGFNTDPFPYSRTLSLSLSYPIFNRFQRENSIASAQISEDNALASIKDQKLTAQQTIITELAVIHNDEAKISVQLSTIRAAEEAVRVYQQRYELGAGLLLDVLTQEQTLVTARTALIQTRLDLRNARAQIEAFIGRDLP